MASNSQSLEIDLQKRSSLAVMRHLLGVESIPDAPTLLEHAMILCIDCEAYEFNHNKVTEVGLAMVSSSDFRAVQPELQGPFAENLLKKIFFYHFRVIENAHLINRRFCPGNPTKNRFGQTRFLTLSQIQDALTSAFNWDIDPEDPGVGRCPIVLIGHALQNDTNMLGSIGIDASILDMVVKTVDTQVLAGEVGLPSYRGHWIGLRNLCHIHGFSPLDSHTAGNDAAYTILNAVFLAMRNELFVDGLETAVNGLGTIQDVVDSISHESTMHIYRYGSATFCEGAGVILTFGRNATSD
ncbi:uncharacterized protein EI97DRAFT_482416 [Westerdykella ornata]|uniref:Gfd2/YDR514C-like C-terminal domain-containing protein n=1 Tax=Westerdykella ornata TaxID=318751 RepID=A0A6A6JUD3_WESOR|nr:uncharacterized protein EI97DRAFT_482416 [Westerdykella ornata]KAF2279713.1 hypothetical protein EI97DRAFT_482416 [Westerdykella ornata]